MADLERQMTMKEREYVHTLSTLEAELKNAEEGYNIQVRSCQILF